MGHTYSISGRRWHLLACQEGPKAPKPPETPKLVEHHTPILPYSLYPLPVQMLAEEAPIAERAASQAMG